MHLLNGPLGSLVGLFENVVLSLCTTDDQKPKITSINRYNKKCRGGTGKGLYNRSVQIFPQYAHQCRWYVFQKTLSEKQAAIHRYLPTGRTQTMTSLRLNAALPCLLVWKYGKTASIKQVRSILDYCLLF